MGFFSRLLLQLEFKREASFRDELLILFEITFANSRRKLIFERDSFRDYFCKLKRWLLFEITFANSRGGFFSRLLLQTQERASFRDYLCKLKRWLLFERVSFRDYLCKLKRGLLFEGASFRD